MSNTCWGRLRPMERTSRSQNVIRKAAEATLAHHSQEPQMQGETQPGRQKGSSVCPHLQLLSGRQGDTDSISVTLHAILFPPHPSPVPVSRAIPLRPHESNLAQT